MAHADYICCACCDITLYRDNEAEAKIGFCTRCAVYLSMRFERPITDHTDLLDLIQSYPDKAELHESLKTCEFKKCYYTNLIDEAYDHVFPLKTET